MGRGVTRHVKRRRVFAFVLYFWWTPSLVCRFSSAADFWIHLQADTMLQPISGRRANKKARRTPESRPAAISGIYLAKVAAILAKWGIRSVRFLLTPSRYFRKFTKGRQSVLVDWCTTCQKWRRAYELIHFDEPVPCGFGVKISKFNGYPVKRIHAVHIV